MPSTKKNRQNDIGKNVLETEERRNSILLQ
jgi:hypothetical protein